MRLDDKDFIVAADVARPAGELVLVTTRGCAKRVPLSEFPSQGRGGGGVRAARVTSRNGTVAGACAVESGDELYLATARSALRTAAESLPVQSRATQGAPLLSAAESEPVIALSRLGASINGEGNGAALQERKPRGKRAKAETPLTAAKTKGPQGKGDKTRRPADKKAEAAPVPKRARTANTGKAQTG